MVNFASQLALERGINGAKTHSDCNESSPFVHFLQRLTACICDLHMRCSLFTNFPGSLQLHDLGVDDDIQNVVSSIQSSRFPLPLHSTHETFTMCSIHISPPRSNSIAFRLNSLNSSVQVQKNIVFPPRPQMKG
jgi:hypothetical protein